MAIKKPAAPKTTSPASSPKPKMASPGSAQKTTGGAQKAKSPASAPKSLLPPKRVNKTGNANSGKTYVAKKAKVGKAPGQHTVAGSDHVYTDPKTGKKTTVFVAAKPKKPKAGKAAAKYKRKPKGAGGGEFSK